MDTLVLLVGDKVETRRNRAREHERGGAEYLGRATTLTRPRQHAQVVAGSELLRATSTVPASRS